MDSPHNAPEMPEIFPPVFPTADDPRRHHSAYWTQM